MSRHHQSEPEAMNALADTFFGAIEAADLATIERCYAPDAEIWINATGRIQGRDDNLKLLRAFTSRVSELDYDVEARDFFAGGFVQRHTLRGKLSSGAALSVPVCLVVHVAGGQIVRLYEYLDPAAIAPVFA